MLELSDLSDLGQLSYHCYFQPVIYQILIVVYFNDRVYIFTTRTYVSVYDNKQTCVI